jgi:hypothetical protein
MESGRETEDKDEHSQKHWSSKEVIEFGIIMAVKDEHP